MKPDAIATYLAEMFESDPGANDYYERFPPYQHDSAIGLKPWHPPLSEVWAVGEQCPDTFPNAGSWAEAWQHVSKLHADYLRAKGKR